MLYLHAIWTKDNCEEKVRIFTVEKEFIQAVRECCYSKGLAYSIEIYFLEANDKIEQGRCLGSRGLPPEQKQQISVRELFLPETHHGLQKSQDL